MRILLLNPPGKKIYVRNYYCSSTSKASYLFHPIDLVMLSARLSEGGNTLFFRDAIADHLSPEKSLNEIARLNPDAVVALTGCVSWNEDIVFFNSLKKRLPETTIIVGGDLFFDNPESFLKEHPSLSAIYFDFISQDVNHYLAGDFEHVRNMAFRQNDTVIVRKNKPEPKDLNDFPVPRQDLFISKNYRFPFAKRHPFATILTSYGCPYDCLFCVGGNIGFASRDSENVLKEIMMLKELGVSEIFFEDFTFGIPRKNIVKLLDAIIQNRMLISWTCFSRVDVLDRDMLCKMKEAGCHTIIFGVESGDERILKLYNKKYTKDQVTAAFKHCKEIGIRTAGTFIIGLPEETEESCLATIRFAKELDCDFASFNVAVPRSGTALREKSIEKKLIKDEDIQFDHSGDEIAMATNHLNKEEVLRLKRLAVREFYFRPGYILRRIRNLSSFWELRQHVSESWSLFRKN